MDRAYFVGGQLDASGALSDRIDEGNSFPAETPAMLEVQEPEAQ